MSKAEERAFERYPDYRGMDGGYITQIHKRKVFTEGYHQAEEDNELTWEDIKQICDISFEEACRLQRNMKGSLIYKKQHYQIVLKRFKDFKERKEK